MESQAICIINNYYIINGLCYVCKGTISIWLEKVDRTVVILALKNWGKIMSIYHSVKIGVEQIRRNVTNR